MKYNVTLSYHGSATFEVEAESESAAVEAARNKAYSLNGNDFLDAVELMEDSHDAEPVREQEDVTGNNFEWKKPRFTKDDITVDRYDEAPYLKTVNDSMELDSAGEDLAYLRGRVKTRDGDEITAEVSLRVQGDVRVFFKGETYRCSSNMPKELLDCYHNGRDPEELDPEYRVDDNNWLEMFVTLSDRNGTLYDNSDVVDAEGDADWKSGFIDSVLEVLNWDEGSLSRLFREGDKVRWADPDASLATQMTEKELKEYRERVFSLDRKDKGAAFICDGHSEAVVPYSELLTCTQK